MLIDLHVHTSRYSSGCSVIDPNILVQSALKAGLNGLALTEHQCLWSQKEIKSLCKQQLKIFAAREISINNLHILIFGIKRKIPTTNNIIKLINLIHAMGGAAILAHPFLWGRAKRLLSEEPIPIWYLFDAIEALSGKMLHSECETTKKIAKKLGIPISGGSDAHTPNELGRYYTQFYNNIENENDLVIALRNQSFTPKIGPNCN